MGRLIDADALKSVFTEKSTKAVCGDELCKAIISRIDDAPTASDIEKIKVESADMLNGWNACGIIDEDAYSQLWDFYNGLLNRAYEQGLKDAPNDRRKKNE